MWIAVPLVLLMLLIRGKKYTRIMVIGLTIGIVGLLIPFYISDDGLDMRAWIVGVVLIAIGIATALWANNKSQHDKKSNN